jgi:hypothetical protein
MQITKRNIKNEIKMAQNDSKINYSALSDSIKIQQKYISSTKIICIFKLSSF